MFSKLEIQVGPSSPKCQMALSNLMMILFFWGGEAVFGEGSVLFSYMADSKEASTMPEDKSVYKFTGCGGAGRCFCMPDHPMHPKNYNN